MFLPFLHPLLLSTAAFPGCRWINVSGLWRCHAKTKAGRWLVATSKGRSLERWLSIFGHLPRSKRATARRTQKEENVRNILGHHNDCLGDVWARDSRTLWQSKGSATISILAAINIRTAEKKHQLWKCVTLKWIKLRSQIIPAFKRYLNFWAE